jgi:cytochrome c biogenesis protein CcmG/thiol:disulfide interchange protein DsbE
MRPVLVGVAAGLLVSAAVVALVILTLPEEPLGRPPTTAPSISPAVPSASVGPGVSPSGSIPASGGPGATGIGSGSPAVGLDVGDQAPPLVVDQLGGGQIDLANLRGKPIWVNFTASWCPTCRDELPMMERIGQQLGGDLAIVVVDVREDEDTVASLATELALTLPVGMDRDGQAQQAWGAFALPVHYWLDGDGRVRAFVYGGAGPEQFVEGVHEVLPEAEIEL